MKPRSWTSNGYRYWSLVTAEAEVVASVPEGYTPHFPPMHATYEVYTIKKGLAKFEGYAEGEQRARLHHAFGCAFGRQS